MIYLIAGFAAGVLSGMGVGGGMILIPALSVLGKVEQHVAQSINLFYFIPTATVALIVHIKNKNVSLKAAAKMASSGIFAAFLGAYLAVSLSGDMLRKIFALFAIAMGISEIIAGIRKNS